MPTGYTADIAEGKPISFRQFAMTCARAFGALITMRDDPHDAEIPEKFEPSSYYTESHAKARARLNDLRRMSSAEIATAAAQWNSDRQAEYRQTCAETSARRDRYEAMLTEVRAWIPPSPDHVELRSFMIKQLTESLDFDCREREQPHILDENAWFRQQLDAADHDISYSAKSMQEEAKRAAARTLWVQQLRDSLS